MISSGKPFGRNQFTEIPAQGDGSNEQQIPMNTGPQNNIPIRSHGAQVTNIKEGIGCSTDTIPAQGDGSNEQQIPMNTGPQNDTPNRGHGSQVTNIKEGIGYSTDTVSTNPVQGNGSIAQLNPMNPGQQNNFPNSGHGAHVTNMKEESGYSSDTVNLRRNLPSTSQGRSTFQHSQEGNNNSALPKVEDEDRNLWGSNASPKYLLSHNDYFWAVQDLLKDPTFLQTAKTTVKISDSDVTSTDKTEVEGIPPAVGNTGLFAAAPKELRSGAGIALQNPPPGPEHFIPAANMRPTINQPLRCSGNSCTCMNMVTNPAPSTSNYGNIQGIPSISYHGNILGIPGTSNYENILGIPGTSKYRNIPEIPRTSYHGNIQGIPSKSYHGNIQGIPGTSNYGKIQGIRSILNYGNDPVISSTSNHGNIQDILMPPRMNSVIMDNSRVSPPVQAQHQVPRCHFCYENVSPIRGNKTEDEDQSFPRSQAAVQEPTITHKENTYIIAITYCCICKISKENFLSRPGQWPPKQCYKCGKEIWIIRWTTFRYPDDKEVIYIGGETKSGKKRMKMKP